MKHVVQETAGSTLQLTLTLVSLSLLFHPALAQDDSLTQPPDRPRVIISTDLGGDDEDDIQSLIHYLMYADRFDTQGIISSPPGGGRDIDILRVLDNSYRQNWKWMRQHAFFPSTNMLRSVVKQGAVESSPPAGFSAPTQGSEWIIRKARSAESRPLWILVWGSITDVAQALHDAPEILPKLRVHFIASWNRRQDPTAFAYIEREHPKLFMIQNETTFRGWYQGGDQSQEWGNRSFVSENIAGHGELGERFAACRAAGVSPGSIKMGDTPTVAYLLRGNPEEPTLPHWGGRFVLAPDRPNWFVDDPSPAATEPPYAGARTVNRWRLQYLEDWKKRLDWCLHSEAHTNWRTLRKRSDAWFGNKESLAIAANVLSHQSSVGGWPRNARSFQISFQSQRGDIRPSLDNGATVGEISFLARMFVATDDPLFRDRCIEGVDYVLAAQDGRSGGWPQRYPLEDNYGRHITYNDNAMINAMQLLSEIASGREPFASIVDPARKAKCGEAVSRGIRCILNTQVVQHGRLTAWCAQHDRSTLLPCKARSYEHSTISGMESAGVLQFLMKIRNPTREIVTSVHAGARWFEETALDSRKAHDSPPNSTREWARFYELGTNRPVFSGRDGVIRFRIKEIEQERRKNYSWFNNRPTQVLKFYQKWAERHPPTSQKLRFFEQKERLLHPSSTDVQDREVSVRSGAAVANISHATRIDYPAKTETEARLRIILCPSGDYLHLKLRRAHQQAATLAASGINTTILKYRTPSSLDGRFSSEIRPLDDLTELIRQLRTESEAETKIGIVGTEAGGHLALMAAIHSRSNETRPDCIAVANAPAAVIPSEWAVALLGREADNRELLHYYSADLHADSSIPATYFSYRSENLFRNESLPLIERLRALGVQISLADDAPNSGGQLPLAALEMISRE